MDQLEFKISSALKKIIGRDLITDDFIAVFELVKNSFDAHSRKVTITFEDDCLIIEDNGKGMSLTDIKEKWLFVAYSAKNEGEEDKEFEKKNKKEYRNNIQPKRYYAGAKGIGRFSCDRLGQKLQLITRKMGEPTLHELEVDWGKFEEDATEEFVNIKVNHRTLPSKKYPNLKNGTILKITGLHSSWPRSKLQQLKYSLEKLISPFPSNDGNRKQEFSILMRCLREEKADKEEIYERDKVNGPIKNFIFETLKVKTTQIRTTISKDTIETELVDRGTPIYLVREPNKSYKLLEEAHYNLYFLNTAAKNNFTRQMGFQPVQFGSVFLFKNGFRVYPFGNTGDDSLGLDYRKQQGYARFLGSRDLLGRIEIFTDDENEFKEVSSRDGGLVKTKGYNQLIDSFYDKCLKRLERYVVDVQWAYKIDENLKLDKDKDNISIIAASIGGRAQFADVLRKLADSKDLQIISYNKDLINILNEKLDTIPPEVFTDLTKIAEKTGDNKFKKDVNDAQKRYLKLLKEKEEAEKQALAEGERRVKAEEEARRAEEAQRKAEEKAKKAEEAQKRAELLAKEKELKRREEEIKRKEAEQRAKEEAEKRKDAETNLKTEQQKNRYLQSTRKTISDDAEQLVHSIKITATGIEDSLDSLKTHAKDNKLLLKDVEKIEYHINKILKISNIITKSNFRLQDEVQKIDLPEYIKEYIDTYSYAYKEKVSISVTGKTGFVTKLSILDVAIILDNLISNSVKSGAKKIKLEFSQSKNKLIVDVSDDGKGLPAEYLKKPAVIFQLGVTSTKTGSGIGLYTVYSIMNEKKYGKIEFLGNGIKLRGAAFRLTFD